MTNFMINESSKERRKQIIIDRQIKPALWERDRDNASSELKSCLNDSQELGRTSLLESFINNSALNRENSANRTLESPRGETAMGPIGLGNDDIAIVSTQKGGLVGQNRRVDLEADSDLPSNQLLGRGSYNEDGLPLLSLPPANNVSEYSARRANEVSASLYQSSAGLVGSSPSFIQRPAYPSEAQVRDSMMGGGIVFQGGSPKYGLPS